MNWADRYPELETLLESIDKDNDPVDIHIDAWIEKELNDLFLASSNIVVPLSKYLTLIIFIVLYQKATFDTFSFYDYCIMLSICYVLNMWLKFEKGK